MAYLLMDGQAELAWVKDEKEQIRS